MQPLQSLRLSYLGVFWGSLGVLVLSVTNAPLKTLVSAVLTTFPEYVSSLHNKP